MKSLFIFTAPLSKIWGAELKSTRTLFPHYYVLATEKGTDIGSILKTKYGDTLSRDHIDKLDRSKLSTADKEILRKLKISLANKGRKPWNIGKSHSPDTIQLIRQRTQQAMFRDDVRERWTAHWVPKTHTEETKGKLRSIMLQKEKKKTSHQAEWFRLEMGIDLATYKSFTSRLRNAYRRAFNLKLKIQSTKTAKDGAILATDLRKVDHNIINIHIHKNENKIDSKEQTTILNENNNNNPKRYKTSQAKLQVSNGYCFGEEQNKDYLCIKKSAKELSMEILFNNKKKFICKSKLLYRNISLQEENFLAQETLDLISKTLKLHRKANEKFYLFQSILDVEEPFKDRSDDTKKKKLISDTKSILDNTGKQIKDIFKL